MTGTCRTYLHFDSLERVPTSGPRLPRDAVETSVRHVAGGVVAAVEVGHVAAVVPPGAGEAPGAAAVLELATHLVVVDVERREAAAVVLQQRIAGARRSFAVPGDVQPVAVSLVGDAEVIVVDVERHVVPVSQTDAQRVVFAGHLVDHFVSEPVLASNAFATAKFYQLNSFTNAPRMLNASLRH